MSYGATFNRLFWQRGYREAQGGDEVRGLVGGVEAEEEAEETGCAGPGSGCPMDSLPVRTWPS